MEKLLKDVIKGLEDKKDFSSRWCEYYKPECRDYLANYGDTKNYCGHRCEYCDKYRWVVDRAKDYEASLGIPWKEVLASWEEDRDYWFMNYYSESNQPLIDGVESFVFDTLEEFRATVGHEFICPCCKGISTNPYECNSGKKVGGKVCDWKSYGLFQHDLVFCYVKSLKKGEKMFIPVSLQVDGKE